MSEKSLDQLIQTLKAEGIEAAERESHKILEAAKAESLRLQDQAMQQKQEIIAAAEQEAESIVAKGKVVLQQAARDVGLTVQQDLIKLFQATFRKELRKGFSSDLIQKTISSVVENIGNNVEIRLPSPMLIELRDFIHDQLQNDPETISFIEEDSMLNAMQIHKTDEGWSYTISPETIAEALEGQLTANWLQILRSEA